jgi:hypothetical protein
MVFISLNQIQVYGNNQKPKAYIKRNFHLGLSVTN